MIPAYTYKTICEQLTYAFKYRYPNQKARLVGLLFARPYSTLAKEEILPNLEYFHHRSGDHCDFFCGGYGAYWNLEPKTFPDQRVVCTINQVPWLFSTIKFNELRKEIESLAKWQYSGGVDLILFNAYYNSLNEIAALNTMKTAVFNLDRMRTNGIIFSIETLFEDVFRASENSLSDDPLFDFIDNRKLDLPRGQHPNIDILIKRMDDALKQNDFGGVLHASASIFETMAKDIIGLPSVQSQTLASFFERYRKDSSLPSGLLDYILDVYKLRNITPLSGHGSTNTPNITKVQAVVLAEMAKALVRIEYGLHTSSASGI